MNLQTLISKIGLGPFTLLVLVGLGVCFACRRKPWVIFLWMPMTGGFSYVVGKILFGIAAFIRGSGLDVGFSGMEGASVLPLFGILVLGIIVCIVSVPRRGAWRLSTSIPAVVIYSTLFLLSDLWNTASVVIELFDATGNPLPHVPGEYDVSGGSWSRKRRPSYSDADGSFTLEFRQGQTFWLAIKPNPESPQDVDTSPTYWNLAIGPLKNSPGQLLIRHRWERSLAVGQVDEGFTEVIPQTRQIRLRLTLPNHGSLDPSPCRERIRAAFAAFEEHHPSSLTYSDVCRNVESIEFIPRLIEAYRSNGPAYAGVADALAKLAAILSQLDLACQKVQRTVKYEPYYPRHMLENQVTQFCIWAGISEDARADVPRALEKVREKIAASATLLVDFALDELPRDPGVLKVPSELRQLAYPHLPRVLAALIENPPQDWQSASHWDHPLWSMGAHFNDLQPLFTSENPILVLIACDATPTDELEHGIAAQTLAHLTAARPKITDPMVIDRVDDLIKMLKARLK